MSRMLSIRIDARGATLFVRGASIMTRDCPSFCPTARQEFQSSMMKRRGAKLDLCWMINAWSTWSPDVYTPPMTGKTHRTPPASSEVVSRFMKRLRRADTGPEVALRRELHRRGVRFRLHRGDLPGRPDIVVVRLRRLRMAVFVDGCFWHGCPEHAVAPKANAAWWTDKIATNRERDARKIANSAPSGGNPCTSGSMRMRRSLRRALLGNGGGRTDLTTDGSTGMTCTAAASADGSLRIVDRKRYRRAFPASSVRR